ncbi:GNAT family N-acetyltransferase [Carboxylicivirga sp. N1Y90]|uniref:GNAT family N-acetyltransferase n=1 Tax=Carboxylicivirga fragile TaxID=3417571 RepID=UPI003D34A1A9|nr:GNAT family N-acetyltransferase [Marinilabiliaceae bacterium N1Y90]
MFEIVRTDADNKDFIKLVKELDSDLAIRDGEDHAFYAQYNKVDQIKNVVIVLEDEKAVACGAIKHFSKNSMEVKRMYTLPAQRGKGLASLVLKELEIWAKELGYNSCLLETGLKQPEAIALYQKNGYHIIPNYGQYADVENSRCFEKHLT